MNHFLSNFLFDCIHNEKREIKINNVTYDLTKVVKNIEDMESRHIVAKRELKKENIRLGGTGKVPSAKK